MKYLKICLLIALPVTMLVLAACAQQTTMERRDHPNVITEERFDEITPELQEMMSMVRQHVHANFAEVQNLYINRLDDHRDMGGTLDITLFFGFEGHVDDVVVEPIGDSSFPEEFIKEAEEIIKTWQIPTTNTIFPYRFTRKLGTN